MCVITLPKDTFLFSDISWANLLLNFFSQSKYNQKLIRNLARARLWIDENSLSYPFTVRANYADIGALVLAGDKSAGNNSKRIAQAR